jgi:site-specific DNA-methyltransferase (adenine-specific)
MVRLQHGDCLEVMRSMEADSVDAIVSDPPYGISFLGKEWDHGIPGRQFWEAALHVAKPGAHLLAFGGTRTFHRLACAIEDAGWEIRDCIMWVYGSGFPKSHNVANGMAKREGAKREGAKREGAGTRGNTFPMAHEYREYTDTDTSRIWRGWGTSLKPAWEPIIVARKPLRGTVANNVREYGTGAINIDGCRVGAGREKQQRQGKDDGVGAVPICGARKAGKIYPITQPRWPANLIHDGSKDVVKLFPDDAARFFYCSKASRRDRDEGCEALDVKQTKLLFWDKKAPARNYHPTVKPTALMRYLCRLITPPKGTVLDPFMGSGSTGKAAVLEGFDFVGIEKEAEYIEIARQRITSAARSLIKDMAG